MKTIFIVCTADDTIHGAFSTEAEANQFIGLELPERLADGTEEAFQFVLVSRTTLDSGAVLHHRTWYWDPLRGEYVPS